MNTARAGASECNPDEMVGCLLTTRPITPPSQRTILPPLVYRLRLSPINQWRQLVFTISAACSFFISCHHPINMKKCSNWLALFFTLLCAGLHAQGLQSSNLPILVITTDLNPNTGKPFEIPDEPKVPGRLILINRPNGERNYLSDQSNPAFLNYQGRIAIEIRGSSSQWIDKKPYGFTTLQSNNSNNNVSLLGMPAENDWILLNLAYDPTFIRDYLALSLAKDLTFYSPRTRFCEVVVNGDYKGLYILTEKIKVDQQRVNVQKSTPTDILFPQVSGGYITKADKTTGGDPIAWLMGSNTPVQVTFIHDYPAPETINPFQHQYIFSQFQALDISTANQNTSPTSGYPSIIDIPTFIDYILLNELSSNADAYQFSTFFHKDRGGKLRAGPPWDFNLSFGNDFFIWGFNRSLTNVWQFDNGDNTGPYFWKNLFLSPPFQCRLAARWKTLSAEGGPWSPTQLDRRIEEVVQLLEESIPREKERWQVFGFHANQINTLKSWISARVSWLNQTLGKVSPCEATPLSSLVISGIHYNPISTATFSSDQLEFIEITYTGTQEADISGYYFSEPGLNFQFPAGSLLQPQQKIYLCSDAQAFSAVYGKKAVGQFSRNLSNKSQRLILSAPFGELIDEVTYQDSAPWPVEADGKGGILQLRDNSSDNGLAENWFASPLLTTISDFYGETTTTLSPNPCREEVLIRTEHQTMRQLTLLSANGTVLKHVQLEPCTSVTLRMDDLPPGCYFLKIMETEGHTQTKRLVKVF